MRAMSDIYGSAMAEDRMPKNEDDFQDELPPGLLEGLEADPRDLEIVALKEEAGALKDRLLRLAAELDNLRKRAERERAEATLYAATNFARDMLSVADSMSRALAAVPAGQRGGLDETTRNLFGGIEVTERELLNVFQRYNITRVIPLGLKFDPNMHQAMFEAPSADQPPGTVVQVLQAGFAIGERCLRPALVGVAKAVPPPPEETGPAPQVLDI
jgi:molecular chaperone GrpE